MKRNTELLYEIGSLRFVNRTWKQFLNPDVANVAEHSFRVMWIALLLAKMEGANEEKVLKIALVHDVSESRTGDVHHLSRLYTDRHEAKAIKDTFDQTSLHNEMITLFHEAEQKQSLEAQIVKDADNLDVECELVELEYRNHTLGVLTNELRKERVYERLYTKSAKVLWDEIHTTSPHDWHFTGTNRFTSGDWQKKK